MSDKDDSKKDDGMPKAVEVEGGTLKDLKAAIRKAGVQMKGDDNPDEKRAHVANAVSELMQHKPKAVMMLTRNEDDKMGVAFAGHKGELISFVLAAITMAEAELGIDDALPNSLASITEKLKRDPADVLAGLAIGMASKPDQKTIH